MLNGVGKLAAITIFVGLALIIAVLHYPRAHWGQGETALFSLGFALIAISVLMIGLTGLHRT